MTSAEDMAAASVPVAAVVTGKGIHAVATMAWIRAYRTWGTTGLIMARNLHPTVKAWNAATGSTCRTRADVGVSATELIKRIEAERDGVK
jgi:hypothetical protein